MSRRGRRKNVFLFFYYFFFSLGSFKVHKSLNRSVCATAGTDPSNEAERVTEIEMDDAGDFPNDST